MSDCPDVGVSEDKTPQVELVKELRVAVRDLIENITGQTVMKGSLECGEPQVGKCRVCPYENICRLYAGFLKLLSGKGNPSQVDPTKVITVFKAAGVIYAQTGDIEAVTSFLDTAAASCRMDHP